MIEQLYLDLAEETNDQKFYGKLFQDCHAAAEELFRVDRMNELHLKVTPKRVFVVPEVLEVHVIPSDEVRIDPEAPTATNVLFT